MCILLALQHYLTMFGSTMSIPLILAPELCLKRDDPDVAYLMSTMFFFSGIATLLQVTLGIRLPLIQGGSFTMLGCQLTEH